METFMKKTIIDWLVTAAEKYPDRTAYTDGEQSLTFSQVYALSSVIMKNLTHSLPDSRSLLPQTIVVITDRSITVPSQFFGIVMAGYVYVPVGADLPSARIHAILDTAMPSAVILPASCSRLYEDLKENWKCIIAETLFSAEACSSSMYFGDSLLSSDPLYIIFTSGSTGRPKGVITSHESLMRYICDFRDMMDIKCDDRLAGQSPLDYIAAIRDIYLPLLTGCTTYFLKKQLFMEPEILFSFMNEHRITAAAWSAPSLKILTSLGAFEGGLVPAFLTRLCFSGSVLPCSVLRKWQDALPDCRFINQYGPTEATASCTFYEVDHPVSREEVLPIGKPYSNYKIYLIHEEDEGIYRAAAPGETGEICVGGPCVTLGYYRDPDRTSKSFVQNPLHNDFHDRIYRTGDLGRLSPDGMLEFCGRLDRQIKHMGHRIELDEVEQCVNQIEGIAECACIYLEQKEVLVLFYSGNSTAREISIHMRKSLPGYMVPRKIFSEAELPHLPNGKLNLTNLRSRAEELVL